MMTMEEINRLHTQAFATYALVCGEGNPAASLMLVGEAPGAQEEKAGKPFVGMAGKNLDAFLAAICFAREDLYITNAVKFRPSKMGASGRLSNRTPTRDEVETFRPWLLAEIETIRPRVIATLGNTALRAVTGDALIIGDVHGRLLPGLLPCGAAVFPLYHPASVIYRRELQAVYEEDVKKLAGVMGTMRG